MRFVFFLSVKARTRALLAVERKLRLDLFLYILNLLLFLFNLLLLAFLFPLLLLKLLLSAR
jgi:hypothetical protein